MVYTLKRIHVWNSSIWKVLLCLLLILMILSRPVQACQFAWVGLQQWAVKMIPSLFPFMMISSIMIGSGLDIQLASLISPVLRHFFKCSYYGIYAIFMGFFCGFPMGAKTVAELFEEGKISQSEANTLLCFCNLIGPSYFTGMIFPLLKNLHFTPTPFLIGMYGIPAIYGIILTHIQPTAINTAYDSPRYQSTTSKSLPLTQEASKPLSKSIPSILQNACITNIRALVILGGYVTFINTLRIVLLYLPLLPSVEAILGSILEINGGILAIWELSSLSASAKVFWIMTTLSFSGISCILQAAVFIEKAHLSLWLYLKHKLIVTLISALYYYLIIFHSFFFFC